MRKVTTPTVLQMEATECGAAVLGIILSYYGLHIPLERLRIACGVSRDGSKALNILKAARNYGMEAQGYSTDLSDLKDLKAPIILYWKFNHFVVLEGIRGNKYYINDPATGRRVVKKDAFSKDYTGVALVLRPGPNFKKGGRKQSSAVSLNTRLKYSNIALSFVILASLFLLIPNIVIPGFYKIFIDDILIRGMEHWIIPLIIAMLGLGILHALLAYLQQQHLLRLQLKLMLSGSARFIWHVLHLPILFFQQRFSGDIVERVNANDRIATLLSSELTASIVGLFATILFAAILILFSWQLSLIGIGVAVLNFILLLIVSRRISDTSRSLLQNRGHLSGVEVNGIQNIENLKAQANESEFFQRWSGQHAKIIAEQQQLAVYNQLLLVIPQLLNGLSSVAILGLGGWLIMQGQLTIGTLIAFQSMLINFTRPFSTLLNMGNSLQQIRGDISRLDDVLHYQEDSRFFNTQAPTLLQDEPVEVSINQLSFAYSPLESPLFDNLSLTIPAGSTVSIVGSSGSGKSSLAKLICRLYRPASGKILLNKIDSAELSPEELSKTLALVDQDIFLFAGSIRDNLTMWDHAVSESLIEQALIHACIADIVNARNGLEGEVSEGGRNFSGGQRQRLEIARALIKQPKLLILDEATSSLDAIIEQKILENLKNYACTKIIVTHRLSAIRDSDLIIVLDKGKIIEHGKHMDLMQRKGTYYQLINT